MSDTTLTVQQATILQVLGDYIDQHGYPPSVRELGALAGLRSPSSVRHHLTSLERLGRIRRVPGEPRAVQIINRDGLGSEDQELWNRITRQVHRWPGGSAQVGVVIREIAEVVNWWWIKTEGIHRDRSPSGDHSDMEPTP